MRVWGALLILASGCRGFFNVKPPPVDAGPGLTDGSTTPIGYVQSQLVSDNATYAQAQFPRPRSTS